MIAHLYAGLALDHDEQRIAAQALVNDDLLGVVAALARCREHLVEKPGAQRSETVALEEDLARCRVGGKLGRHLVGV